MSDEDECTWIALEAATKNVVALLCIRKEKCDEDKAPSQVCCGPEGRITAGLESVPAALTREGAGDAAGLTPAGEGASGEKLVKRA